MSSVAIESIFLESFTDRIRAMLAESQSDLIKIASVSPSIKDFEFDGVVYSSFYIINKNHGREIIAEARNAIAREYPGWHLFAICTNGDDSTHMDIIVSCRDGYAQKHRLWIEYTGKRVTKAVKPPTWKPIYDVCDMHDFPNLQ